MAALLLKYQALYVDIAGLTSFMPREAFHDYLEELVDLGFGDRIMWGSDGNFAESIEAIMSAPSLMEFRKRAILCDNAARFLRLDPSPCR
jgi:predicted TIM-barrel fold metal-dependent hydrolase